MAYQSASGIISVSLENVRGVAAATPTYFPVTKPKLSPMPVLIEDPSLRGSPVETYDQIEGVRHDEYEFGGNVYCDSFPVLLRGILGSTDTVAGSATPYTHTIGLANDGGASQPPSVTVVDWDGANGYQLLGGQMDTLSINIGAEKGVDYTTKILANPWVSTTKPTPTFGTIPLIPGWNTTVAIAGSNLAYLSEVVINISRKSQAIFTAGTQAPHVNWASAIDVSGTIKGVIDTTSDPFSTGTTAYGLTRQSSPLTMVITCTDPVTSDYVKFQMSNVQFTEPVRSRDSAYVILDAKWKANGNTTDAVVASTWSPIKTVVSNQTSTAYVGS